ELSRVIKLVSASDVGIFWSTDASGRIETFWGPQLPALNAAVDTLVGQKLTEVFRDVQDESELAQQRSLALRLSSRSKINNHLVRWSDDNEAVADIWLQLSGRPHFEGGEFLGYHGLATDVTSLVIDRQNRLLHERQDEATGFHNAAYFAKRFEKVVKSLIFSERACSLIVIEIDHFRQAAQRYGLETANAVIAEVAGRIRTVLQDRGEVGRVASDQFHVIFPDVDDRGVIADICDRIGRMVSQPYRFENRRIQLGASIGVAMAPFDAVTAPQLLDAANLALRSIKRAGASGYGFYSVELAEESNRDIVIQQELEGALSRGEFRLEYAPIVCVHSNEIITFKGQLRWNSPELGEVPHATFWPIIESSDASVTIGEWMLRQACEDAAKWKYAPRLSLGLPQGFLKAPHMRNVLSDAIAISHLAYSRLEIEVSEEFIAANFEAATKLLQDMSQRGAKIAVTAFGEGSSSISLLADIEFDRVEISPALIRTWAQQPARATAILSAIVSLAKSFDVVTSAIDIDAQDVLAAVASCGVDWAQGPIFSDSLTHAQITDPDSGALTHLKPKGPARQRAERITVLRKIGLVHEDHYYDVLLRNISKTGAKVAGLAGVPVGTEVVLDLGGGQLAVASVVNSDEKSQGLRFEVPLVDDGHGGLMTRYRISPYALAEAGMPVVALGNEQDALKAWKDAKRGTPAFVQLQLSSL
ncbi:MAG: EAL domain-containing protein, partial [Porphyrobacter sp.]|nr:EAL domain-containing protein [Porphyrobacter sp.]